MMRLSRFTPFVAIAIASLIGACSGGSGSVTPPNSSSIAGSPGTASTGRTVLSSQTATPSPTPSATPLATPTPMATPTPHQGSCTSQDRDDCHRFKLLVALRASVAPNGYLALSIADGDHRRHRFDNDRHCRNLDLDDAPALEVESVQDVSVPTFQGRVPCPNRRHDDAAFLRPMVGVTPGPTASPSPTPAPTPQGTATRYYVVMATGDEHHPVVVALIGPGVIDRNHDWLQYAPVVPSIVLRPEVKYHFFVARKLDVR